MKKKNINFLNTAAGVITVTLIISGIITGCLYFYCVAQYNHFEEIDITATVYSLEFVDSSTKMNLIGSGKIKTILPQTTPEQYLVTVSYKDIVEVFDNEELYNAVSVGDEIQLILKQTFNSNNALVKTELILPNS